MAENIVLTINTDLIDFERGIRINSDLVPSKLEAYQKAVDAIEFLQDFYFFEDDGNFKENKNSSAKEVLNLLNSKIKEIELLKLSDWKFNMENK